MIGIARAPKVCLGAAGAVWGLEDLKQISRGHIIVQIHRGDVVAEQPAEVLNEGGLTRPLRTYDAAVPLHRMILHHRAHQPRECTRFDKEA